MNDLSCALRYFPHLFFDRREPFAVKLVGYHIYRESGESQSFSRRIVVDHEKVEFVIEYAVYFDYDIQHMYDLEHIWIYVGHDGRVADAEGSSHGRYVNCFRYRPAAGNEMRITLYCQPGKHAFFPAGELFLLFSDYEDVCGRNAGTGGLLIPLQLQKRLSKDEQTDRRVEEMIRESFSFQPTLEFEERTIPDSVFLPEENLFSEIALRIEKLLGEMTAK